MLLSIPAILLARTINHVSTTVWTRLALNVFIFTSIIVAFPDYFVRHLIERSFPGTMAMTIFLSVQDWN